MWEIQREEFEELLEQIGFVECDVGVDLSMEFIS